jgi:hypothetical protein
MLDPAPRYNQCRQCYSSGCDISYLGVKVTVVMDGADCDCPFHHRDMTGPLTDWEPCDDHCDRKHP